MIIPIFQPYVHWFSLTFHVIGSTLFSNTIFNIKPAKFSAYSKNACVIFTQQAFRITKEDLP